jgi:hypothetical protein
VADTPHGFVALTSLKQGPPDPAQALAEIRRIYFKTTKKTIDNDFAHAIDLLKSLPDEDTRDKAAVYMEGLAQMRKEWQGEKPKGPAGKSKATGRRKAKGTAKRR